MMLYQIKKKWKSKVLKKIVFGHLVLFFISVVCFSQGHTFDEMKRKYENSDFSKVLSIFNGMRKYDKEFRENEKEILLMVAGSLAETIKYPDEIQAASKKMERIISRLLELDHDITINDLHLPEKYKEVVINSYKKVYGELFGRLSVTVNIPGIDIKIGDSLRPIPKYKATTNKGYEPVEFHLWVGKKKSRVFKVALEYDYKKFEKVGHCWVHLKAGKKKKVYFKLRPVF